VLEPFFRDDWGSGNEDDTGLWRIPWRRRIFHEGDEFSDIGFVSFKGDMLGSSGKYRVVSP
jgi:hypothetical protein